MARSLAFLMMVCAVFFMDNRSAKSAVTCVEVPSSVVGTSSRQKATRSECSRDAAKSEARNAAAHNVLGVLGPTCNSRISNATARRLCAARGLTFIGDQAIATAGDIDSLASIPAPGRSAPAFSLAIVPGGELCVALRDLPLESSAKDDPFCLFDKFKKTTVVWRMRGHCGVICK